MERQRQHSLTGQIDEAERVHELGFIYSLGFRASESWLV